MSFPQRRQLLCMLCQWRSFSTSYRRFAEPPASKTPSATWPGRGVIPPPSEQLARAPRSYGKRTEEFNPTPLSRPIGMPYPPEEGQNTGIDNRSLLQKRDDFAKVTSDERWSKHLERREELKEKFRRPYFRDWGNLRFHKGKTFFPPPRPFKGDLSLYFPNLYGQTLLKGGKETVRDTTPVLQNKISVVSIFNGTWAEKQTKSFVTTQVLDTLLGEYKDICQHVRINVEEDGLKRMLIKLFKGGIRREIGEPNWGKYFIVKNALSDEIRENVGLLNSKVGYVYLVDSQCRIRWAGSGEAQDDEKDGLAKGLQRLILEKTEPKTTA